MTTLDRVLRRLVADLDAFELRWALVGGLAVSARAEPGTTRDVDIALEPGGFGHGICLGQHGGPGAPDGSLALAQEWVTAIDASTGAVRWKFRSPRPMVAAVTTTAGRVVFAGELTGDFVTLDAKTGDVLYRFNTGGPMGGGIATYATGGRQYVAAASGSPVESLGGPEPGVADHLRVCVASVTRRMCPKDHPPGVSGFTADSRGATIRS